MPCRMKRSDRTSITSIALSLRATRIAKHSWVNSSSTSIVGAVLDKVIGPHMIAVLRPRGLSARYFQGRAKRHHECHADARISCPAPTQRELHDRAWLDCCGGACRHCHGSRYVTVDQLAVLSSCRLDVCGRLLHFVLARALLPNGIRGRVQLVPFLQKLDSPC